MTRLLKHLGATAAWLNLADDLSKLASKLEAVDPETLSHAVTDLREALASAVPLFQAHGGVSLAERASLSTIMNAQEPALLPCPVLRNGLLEGAQQLWAIASLLRIDDPATIDCRCSGSAPS
jgi:hypothetical protein